MSAPDTAIVIAAGDAARWNNYRGVGKHLVEVDGEPILHRTVRLLQEYVPTVWVVSQNDGSYHQHGAHIYTVKPGDCDADKFYSHRALWAGHTLLIFGDAYYTEDAITTMCSPVDDWTLFCRPGASDITGKQYGECWAYSVPADFLEEFRARVVWLAGMQALGDTWRSGEWELYRALLGQDLNVHDMTTNFVTIDDWSEDFDYPSDYDMWLYRRFKASQ